MTNFYRLPRFYFGPRFNGFSDSGQDVFIVLSRKLPTEDWLSFAIGKVKNLTLFAITVTAVTHGGIV